MKEKLAEKLKAQGADTVPFENEAGINITAGAFMRYQAQL